MESHEKVNSLLLLKDKRAEIFKDFDLRVSKESIELFNRAINSGEPIEFIRWAHAVTMRTLGLKYLKEYLEYMMLLREEKPSR
jgi:hypothetical protein